MGKNVSYGQLVSVVIPAFNDEEYIAETINSVLSQTYKNIEIIVVDDGSTDSTSDVVNKIDGNIRLIFSENGGPAKARNRGIKIARGEFIAFLDADDVWLPYKLEWQLKMFKESTGLVYSSRIWVDDKCRPIVNPPSQTFFPSGNIFKELVNANLIVTSSVVIRKQVIDKIGFFSEKSTFNNCQDYQYWLRICFVFEVEGTGEALLKYRVHDTNRTKNYENRLIGMLGCLATAERLDSSVRKIVRQKRYDINAAYGNTFFYIGKYKLARGAYLEASKIMSLPASDVLRFVLCFFPSKFINILKKVKKHT